MQKNYSTNKLPRHEWRGDASYTFAGFSQEFEESMPKITVRRLFLAKAGAGIVYRTHAINGVITQ